MKRTYPWAVWFAKAAASELGQVVLSKPLDYTSSQSSMQQQVRNAASKLGKRVKIRDGGNFLVVKIVK